MKPGTYNYPVKSGFFGDERGFTLLELMIVLIILGIIVLMAVLNYDYIVNTNSLSAAKKHVEGALKRAKTVTTQENFTYQLIFYPSTDADHPNCFAFFRRQQDGSFVLVDKSTAGESVVDGGYIKLSERVNIVASGPLVITFTPQGTVLSVTGNTTIPLQVGGKSGSVSISSNGNITM